jgi:hypothetical protein
MIKDLAQLVALLLLPLFVGMLLLFALARIEPWVESSGRDRPRPDPASPGGDSPDGASVAPRKGPRHRAPARHAIRGSSRSERGDRSHRGDRSDQGGQSDRGGGGDRGDRPHDHPSRTTSVPTKAR